MQCWHFGNSYGIWDLGILAAHPLSVKPTQSDIPEHPAESHPKRIAPHPPKQDAAGIEQPTASHPAPETTPIEHKMSPIKFRYAPRG